MYIQYTITIISYVEAPGSLFSSEKYVAQRRPENLAVPQARGVDSDLRVDSGSEPVHATYDTGQVT